MQVINRLLYSIRLINRSFEIIKRSLEKRQAYLKPIRLLSA